jgi:hypothetical protein
MIVGLDAIIMRDEHLNLAVDASCFPIGRGKCFAIITVMDQNWVAGLDIGVGLKGAEFRDDRSSCCLFIPKILNMRRWTCSLRVRRPLF